MIIELQMVTRKANHEGLPNHRASNAAGHQTCFKPKEEVEAFYSFYYPKHFITQAFCPRKDLPFLIYGREFVYDVAY